MREITFSILLPIPKTCSERVGIRRFLDLGSAALALAFLETNNDITERKRGDEKLQQARAELAHINRTATLGELTA